MAKTYKEKLLQPEWQRKRLEILERDNWACRECSDKKNTLHVHHLSYAPNTEPWDYPNDNFMTLCHACHEKETNEKKVIERSFINTFYNAGFSTFDLDVIRKALRKTKVHQKSYKVAHSIADMISDEKLREKFVSQYYNL